MDTDWYEYEVADRPGARRVLKKGLSKAVLAVVKKAVLMNPGNDFVYVSGISKEFSIAAVDVAQALAAMKSEGILSGPLRCEDDHVNLGDLFLVEGVWCREVCFTLGIGKVFGTNKVMYPARALSYLKKRRRRGGARLAYQASSMSVSEKAQVVFGDKSITNSAAAKMKMEPVKEWDGIGYVLNSGSEVAKKAMADLHLIIVEGNIVDSRVHGVKMPEAAPRRAHRLRRSGKPCKKCGTWLSKTRRGPHRATACNQEIVKTVMIT